MVDGADRQTRRHLTTGLGLTAVCLVIYGQTAGFDFVHFDDNVYLLENDRARAGLTWGNVGWAFTTDYHANWHPLTWLTYLAEITLFGLDPGVMHGTNAVLHLVNALLVYAVLWRYTGAQLASGLAAGLFAAHPLHVESVAWISERKDLLCALFWLVTLLAYRWHAEKPSAGRYGLVAVALGLSLLAKPMAVTLPVVLLLLDYWPLRRKAGWGRLVLEKVPLLAIAGMAAGLTILAQGGSGSVQTFETIPVDQRFSNAMVAYGMYMYKTVWPVDLAVFYPHPREMLTLWQGVAMAGLLAGITALAAGARERHPYVLVGWLWFLVTLAPVIGLVQVGGQAYADRYTYLPHIGLFLGAVWLARDFALRGRLRGLAAAGAGVAAVIGCSALAVKQTSHWRDTETLFRHTLAVTERNVLAHDILGRYYLDGGRFEEASEQFESALMINGAYTPARIQLAHAAMGLGAFDRAEQALRTAVADAPENVEGLYALGLLLGRLERGEEAVYFLERAVEAGPAHAVVLTASGNALSRLALGESPIAEGKAAEALGRYDAALAVDPGYALALVNKGWLLTALGRLDEARECFEAAVAGDPDSVEAERALRAWREEHGEE